MAKRSRKLTPKTSKLNQPRAGAMKRVVKKPLQKPKRGSWLLSTLAIAILLGSGTLIVGFAWISALFIFNPDQVSWVNKILPAWAQIPLGKYERPQTLKKIELDLSSKKLIIGETLPLYQGTKNSFLMPVFQQRPNCESDCQQLVEIRVYQRSQELEFKSEPEDYYYLDAQLAITGPEESFVMSSLADAALEPQDISIPLPLTKVQRLDDNPPSPGVWFNLRGERQQGTGTVTYGYIIYYNPERSNLQQMLSWKSPKGQSPKWQQVTGDATKELIVDRTVGLEPYFEVYQVKPLKLFLKPIQLEAISLKSATLKDPAYQNALSIARNGLWTPALEWLKFIKKQRKALPQPAQAQMDVIRLHSQLTKAQANKSWASPSEQVLADLIDGRWGKALQVFEASPHNVQEITTLLKADERRLWNRAVAALRVNPNRQEVQAWFALILAVQQGQEAANSWLKTQPQITKDSLAYIQSLLAKLDGETIKLQTSHPSQIVGTVQPIAQVTTSEWLQPNSTAELKLPDNQVWYQVQVSAFFDGKRWLNFPFENLNLPETSSAKFLWATLGINSDPEIQIVIWLPNGEQRISIVAIKAVQLRDNVLRLLVAGPKIPQNQSDFQPKPLALTNTALEWVQPFPITLRELNTQNPSGVKAILASLWESLQKSGEVPPGAIPSFDQMQDKLGDWPVQTIDLTNNGKPEIVLTISAATIASLNQTEAETAEGKTNRSHDRTIILSDSQRVIYTDFEKNSSQRLSAIAKLSGVQSLALLVENADKYSVERWSEKNQRIE
ncbi:MAG: hypothetical protein RMX96_03395 [Nostoc sp. ChiSLP02]|nr:hypothetical protein [Nostoc sp. DedSLP05]MDZ8097810.1 hypothetical protein [Nostoc sp. DedSLP01]MDZ8183895.1 hypothetical protein [Nostoc sp. ChiSLP02]